jgi:hypothetical protein
MCVSVHTILRGRSIITRRLRFSDIAYFYCEGFIGTATV